MSTDPTAPLNEEEDVPALEARELRRVDPPVDDDPGADPEPYGYEETPNDKAHLMHLVTRGRPFILITLDEARQAAVDAQGFDLVAAYATVQLVAEALSEQIDQL